MKRLVTEKLISWKNNPNRKPLIVRGARQVGKTFSIVEFGRNHFRNKIHVIDLEKTPHLRNVFEKDLDPKRIISEFEIFLDKRIDIETDLLFIDEIQTCKPALASLRYFYEGLPELHIIAAGSLIEFSLKDISFPVGRVQTITMNPMNFFEFLTAQGKEISSDAVISSFKALPENLHNSLMNELKNYFFIGGMPEAVKVYINSEKIRSAFEVQKDLLFTFRQDFSKYAGRSDKKCLDDVFISVAKNVGNQIKYTKLSDGYTIPTIKKSFELLADAKLITKIRSANPSGLPLGISASNKIFKALFLDIGLMQQAAGLQVDFEYAKDDLLSIYRGALAEQFVGQEIISAADDELFYWSRNSKSSNAEIDFLLSRKNRIIPIEVKSGPAGKLKSLHLFMNSYPQISSAYVLSETKFAELSDEKLIFLPLYYAYSLAKN